MNNKKYCDAMAELLYYLKGIDEQEIAKIPIKLIDYFKVNASKDYVCKFDYNKPLKELNLKDETKALIGMIYINYICENKEQKQRILAKLNDNEKKYQKELNVKYNVNYLFKHNKCTAENNEEQRALLKYSENKWYKKIISKIKNWIIQK
ncbi:MAG: hypothetical protein J6K42_03890 [Clostridia bacterium]|nr:hypothetical protein [Clostridia bacterium]